MSRSRASGSEGSDASGTAATAAADRPLELPFEAALGRLEEVVDTLERGDLSLEASLVAFEEGVKLSRRCASQLDAAEQRIEILVRDRDTWVGKPFDDATAADPDDDDAGLAAGDPEARSQSGDDEVSG